jgi:hypothetical protein
MKQHKIPLQKRIKSGTLIAALLMVITHNVSASEFDDRIENALKFGQEDAKYGQIKFDLRYRYEYADTKATAPRPAHANTFRLRIGYLTPEFFDFQGFAEYETLYAAQNEYNGVTSGDKRHHVIADPADRHDLNRLWISYKGISDTVIKGGRQRIILDDSRFIGNVGWRQMEQTFDSVLLTNTSIPQLTAKAGYIGRVKNIVSRLDNIEAPFVNINYQFGDFATVTAYGYWLKFVDDKANFGKSNRTYGIALNGSPKLNDDVTMHYTAEYSYQEDHGNNPFSYDAHRYNLMAGATVFGITAKAGVESLGSDENKKAFITPLGTNHKFQGWADRFLVTPATGLRDINVTLSGKVMGTKLMFVYHNFQDDDGEVDFGNEYDFLVKKEFGEHYHVLASYAYYVGDDNAPGVFKKDTQKIWMEAGVTF